MTQPMMTQRSFVCTPHRRIIYFCCVSGLMIYGLSRNALSGTFVVVPPFLEDVEGNDDLGGGPPPPGGVRWQEVYPVSEFAAVPEGLTTITSMRLRPDSRVTNPYVYTAEDYELWLSTTDSAPGPTLSNTFAQNRGDDALLVYKGPVQWETDGASGPPEGPRAFDYVLEFTESFTYDRSDGKNLLVEEVFFAGGFGSIKADAHLFSDTRFIVAIDDSATEGQFRIDGAAVRQFEFVPELAADFDRDGDVDGDDFLAWQTGFGTQAGAQKSDGDYDNDGDVDGDDFLGWQAEFGSGSGTASAAVPEPSSIVLLLAALVGAATLRRLS